MPGGVAGTGWSLSLFAHGVALGIAAVVVLPNIPAAPDFAIETAWEPPATTETEPIVVPKALLPRDQTLSPDAGGSSSGDFDPAQFVAGSISPVRSGTEGALSPLGMASTSHRLALNRAVTPLPTDRNTGGIGNGTGTGVGNGSGPGFFGMAPPTGHRTVFVVDSSRSMNHPHDSPSKTRFRRLKLELLKCITEMKPEDQFYVIFFSNEAHPMPARSFQPSVPGTRDQFLQWIGRAESGGSPTNPIPAFDMALRMQPDVICFLTDGEFDGLSNRRLKSLKQSQIVIHTFAFGETFGEEVLKILADNNRGEYRFVP
ncbi:MAG TPA: vWA domain-containing protein [Planctomycetaceae bacterium]|nr:vWA domain-containing protein [Planctomycetaceae bacterium]